MIFFDYNQTYYYPYLHYFYLQIYIKIEEMKKVIFT